jgi:hypothetical protein
MPVTPSAIYRTEFGDIPIPDDLVAELRFTKAGLIDRRQSREKISAFTDWVEEEAYALRIHYESE